MGKLSPCLNGETHLMSPFSSIPRENTDVADSYSGFAWPSFLETLRLSSTLLMKPSNQSILSVTSLISCYCISARLEDKQCTISIHLIQLDF